MAASVQAFHVGTGEDILTRYKADLLAVTNEFVFVTCFWAPSRSLDILNEILLALSEKGKAQNRKLTVRICFSSLSLIQKLFHTRSPHGHVYDPSTWSSKLHLPDPSRLDGLNLEIKSFFFKPMSVWHAKFIVLDRRAVILTSCNVSWETWLEGAVKLTGPIVKDFVRAYGRYWGVLPALSTVTGPTQSHELGPIRIEKACVHVSPHHANPRFRPLPCQKAPPPPVDGTLNTALLDLFRTVNTNLYIQTPNLTSPPMLDGILEALGRGVSVHIVTCEKLMVFEQLLTAGTTTARCVKYLIRRSQYASRDRRQQESVAEEGMLHAHGRLLIQYYESKTSDLPIQSHVKVTIADGGTVVLGSGNMDRASWYTSMELGVVFVSSRLASKVRQDLDAALKGNTRTVFDG